MSQVILRTYQYDTDARNPHNNSSYGYFFDIFVQKPEQKN